MIGELQAKYDDQRAATILVFKFSIWIEFYISLAFTFQNHALWVYSSGLLEPWRLAANKWRKAMISSLPWRPSVSSKDSKGFSAINCFFGRNFCSEFSSLILIWWTSGKLLKGRSHNSSPIRPTRDPAAPTAVCRPTVSPSFLGLNIQVLQSPWRRDKSQDLCSVMVSECFFQFGEV